MFGYAVGPIFITWYAQKTHLKGLHWVGIVLSAVILLTIPRMKFLKVEKRKPPKLSMSGVKVLLPLLLYVALRSATMGTAQIYGPMYAKIAGLSLIIGGSILTITRIVGMLLSYTGVHIGERIGNSYINLMSSILMLGASVIFSLVDFSYVVHPWSILNFSRNITWQFVFLFVSMLAPGYFSMSSATIEAQKRLPMNAAFASSIAMGLGWSLGNLINLVYSSIFGNNVLFMIRTIWIFAASSLAFSVWDMSYDSKRS